MFEEFLKQYLDLLIIQYRDKQKAALEMTVIIESAYVCFAFLSLFRPEFDLDTATGNRLDILGRIVGVSRIVENAIPKPYFGWINEIALEPRTFSQAPLFDIFHDSGYTPTQLNDAQMKFFIRAKAIKNATSAYLSNNEKPDLQSAIQYLFNSEAIMLDNYNMSMSIYINDTIPTEDIILLLRQNLLPKPQGVRLFLKKIFPGNTFGFAGCPGAKTFGQGKFSQLIFIPSGGD